MQRLTQLVCFKQSTWSILGAPSSEIGIRLAWCATNLQSTSQTASLYAAGTCFCLFSAGRSLENIFCLIVFFTARSCLTDGGYNDRHVTAAVALVSLQNYTATTAAPLLFIRHLCMTWKKKATGVLSGFLAIDALKALERKFPILPFFLITS